MHSKLILGLLVTGNEKIIDEVEEEISQKMKFGSFFTSPTYED